MFPRSWIATKVSALALALAVVLVLPPLVDSREARAQQAQMGPVSKLPLPRFVSLKSDRVNLHEGPSKEHQTLWVYERAGLPVEITAEFEIWRKIRDSEGVEGWVLHSLLSGRRTALVGVGKKGAAYKIHAQPRGGADVAATLQSGVIANVYSCDGAWCLIGGDGYKGYIEQVALWGVYPNEKIP